MYVPIIIIIPSASQIFSRGEPAGLLTLLPDRRASMQMALPANRHRYRRLLQI